MCLLFRLQLYIMNLWSMHNIFIQGGHWIKYCLWPPLLYPLFFVSLLSLSDGFSQQKRAKWRASIFLLLNFFFLFSTLDISTDLSIPNGYYPLCFSFARFSSMITQTLVAKNGERICLCFQMEPVSHSSFVLDLNICVFLSFHLLIHTNVKNVTNSLRH